MSKPPPKTNIEVVFWVDADSPQGGWQKIARVRRMKQCPRCLSVGVVVADGPDHVSLAGTICDDGDCGEVIRIPKGMILGRRVLNELPEAFSKVLRK